MPSTRQLEHQQVTGADGEPAADIANDVAERHGSEGHRRELEERGEVDRRHAAVVEAQDRRGRNRDRRQTGINHCVDHERIQRLHVRLDAGRGGPFRLRGAALMQLVLAREDVSVRTRPVDDEQRLPDRGEFPREPADRGTSRRAEAGLVREDAPAELHEEHDGAGHTERCS